MSGRTIIVGIMAAFCGILATVGVTLLNRGPVAEQVAQMILVAQVEIKTGQKIESNMLTSMEWHGNQLPPHCFQNMSDVVDSFAISTIMEGDLIVKHEIAVQPTMLSPAPGKLAFTIESKTASSNVGANLTAGNRVDILWATSGSVQTPSERPVTVRLLQNVKILGIGQVTGEKDNSQKSITFELGPKMDENLLFAQAHGTLALSLRNPSDEDGIEPLEITNLSTLMKEYEANRDTPKPPSAWEVSVKNLVNRLVKLETSLTQPAKPSVDTKAPNRKTLERITLGMRALAIETPSESTALAGLLEPGDRIDLVLTLDPTLASASIALLTWKTEQAPSETLIENVEILAVDTKLQAIEGDDEKKMSNSVSIIIKNEMKHDILRAMKLGTLTLVLRGKYENDGTEPITVTTVDDFIRRHMPVAPVAESQVAGTGAAAVGKILTYRGGAGYFIPVSVAENANY